MTVEIEGGDASYVSEIVDRLNRSTDGAAPPFVPVSDSDVQNVKQAIEEATGLEVVELPAAMDRPLDLDVEFQPPPGPARRAPRVENDPDIRDRQRQAAANAREALAAKRAAEKAERDAEATVAPTTDTEPIEAAETSEPVTPSPAKPAPRRGRPPKAASTTSMASTQDLSGDREGGDTQHGPDNEPNDPHAQAQAQAQTQAKPNGAAGAPPVTVLSNTAKKQVCFAAMTEVAKVSPSGLDEVKRTVGKYGVTKIKDVPEDRMDEFWTDTEALCGTFNVLFPPANTGGKP